RRTSVWHRRAPFHRPTGRTRMVPCIRRTRNGHNPPRARRPRSLDCASRRPRGDGARGGLLRVGLAAAPAAQPARARLLVARRAGDLAVWHVPRLYDSALVHPTLHDVEHVCWVTSGLLMWTLLVDPGAHRRLTAGGRVALAVAMFAAGQVLADVLIFTFHV